MSFLTSIDDKFIASIDRTARSVRRKLRLSYPAFMASAAIFLIPVIGLGIFLSNSNFLLVKLPILVLCAVLAATTVRQIYDSYVWLHASWTPSSEAILRRSTMNLRAKLRPVRLLIGCLAAVQIVTALPFSLIAIQSGNGIPEVAATIALPCLMGLPTVFVYHYLLCADPAA